MTSTEIYSRLRVMRDGAGVVLFRRIELATRLLADRAWVEAPELGGGDAGKALDRLEEDCFGDVCGAVSLAEMLEIYHHIPDEAAWKKHRYNLRKMRDAMVAARKKPVADKREGPKDPHAVAVEQLRKAIQELKAENAELRRENLRLKRRLRRIQQDVGELQLA